tara:strand:+ start:22601 stop:22882 length:282 start_codon:yes stop_codon:yes gene_type:complete
MTTITDLKIYALNTTALAFNFMQIDIILKIMLTAVAIGYTLQKWYLMNTERKIQKRISQNLNAAENKKADEPIKAGKNTIVKNGIVRKTKASK